LVLTESNRAQVAADLLAQARQALGEDASRPR
jgi:hypothetical protein